MKAKHIEDVLDELKSLRKKVKKSAQAQAKMEDKLDHVEALVRAIYHQAKDEHELGEKQDKSEKKGKKGKKKAKLKELSVEELAQLAAATEEKAAQL